MALASTPRGRAGFGALVNTGTDKMAWYFLRISGVALVVLAGGHLFITHYLNVPSETTFDFVSKRWSNPLWRSFDLMLLMAALWHGLIGMRFSIADYLRNLAVRQFTLSTLWVFGFAFTVVGAITIISFDEEMSRTNSGPLSGQMWIGDLLGYSLFLIAAVTYAAIVAVAIWIFRSVREGRSPLYTGDIGQYAWVLHRASGIGVLFFLLIHILDIMLIGLGRDVYDHTVEFYANWFVIPMEMLLVGAVIYHLLNGLRIVAVNFSASGPSMEKKYFWWVMALTVLLTLPSAIVILLAEV